jgi:hypothetical protein
MTARSAKAPGIKCPVPHAELLIPPHCQHAPQRDHSGRVIAGSARFSGAHWAVPHPGPQLVIYHI